jgi:hypothetical protein
VPRRRERWFALRSLAGNAERLAGTARQIVKANPLRLAGGPNQQAELLDGFDGNEHRGMKKRSECIGWSKK